MGIRENNLKKSHDRTLSKWQRLWRINNGIGWIGTIISRTKEKIVLSNPRRFMSVEKGLHVDQVGFDSVIITPEMVGKRVAVFVGCELKATANDKLSDDQINTRELIVAMGGIHREVRPDRIIESGFFSQDRNKT